jgi:hypothetical protein
MFLNCGYPAEWVNGKAKYVHVSVMEEKLGRKLGKHEVVHHKDGNKTNNDPDNLMLLRTQSDHGIIHTQNRESIEVFETKDGSAIVVKDQKPCAYCGGMFVPNNWHNKYCSLECGAKAVLAKRPKVPPTVDPEVLARQVWETPATALATEYGVSDTTIKMWCRKLGISKPGPGYWAKKSAGVLE